MDRPGWIDPALYPFSDRWLDLGGGRLHYVDEGSASPTLLMLHGNPTWSFQFRGLIAELSAEHRCVAVDYPGFGLSSAPPGYGFTPAEHAMAIERLVLELDLRDLVPVFHDWGGPIALWLAGRHPDRIAGLVVGNTWAWPMRGNAGAWVFSKFLGSPLGGVLIRNGNVFVQRFVPSGIRRRDVEDEVMAHYRGPFPTPASREPIAALPGAITGASDWLAQVESGLARLREKPALILWPDADVAFRDSERERWERELPNHRTVILRGVGHYMWEDDPADCVAAIRSWRPALAAA